MLQLESATATATGVELMPSSSARPDRVVKAMRPAFWLRASPWISSSLAAAAAVAVASHLFSERNRQSINSTCISSGFSLFYSNRRRVQSCRKGNKKLPIAWAVGGGSRLMPRAAGNKANQSRTGQEKRREDSIYQLLIEGWKGFRCTAVGCSN